SCMRLRAAARSAWTGWIIATGKKPISRPSGCSTRAVWPATPEFLLCCRRNIEPAAALQLAVQVAQEAAARRRSPAQVEMRAEGEVIVEHVPALDADLLVLARCDLQPIEGIR